MNGKVITLPLKRMRLGLTDYRRRKKLILSGLPRFTVRFSNRYILIQLIEARIGGDHTIASFYSRELATRYGWKASCINIPAAYLSGLVAGYRSLKAGVEKAVLDAKRFDRGFRCSAVLKGALDAGIDIPHGEDIFPSESRIRGEHIASYAALLEKVNPEAYRRRFSLYLARGLDPKDLPRHFDETYKAIVEEYGEV